jgi:hypothetical protein
MQDTLIWKRYYTTLPDGGPFYTETNTGHAIVEPWNALSSLAIVIPAVYWAIRIRKNIRDNLFIAFCIPLLALGGIGSTLFHAFRTSRFLLIMDWLPIVILSFAVSLYLWQKVTKRWWLTALIAVTGILIRYFLFRSATFSHHTAINIGYVISGAMIFIPALLVQARTGWFKAGILALSLALFGLALFFREADASGMFGLPMGTHFLWHIASGAGTLFLASYLYHISRQRT